MNITKDMEELEKILAMVEKIAYLKGNTDVLTEFKKLLDNDR